MLHSFNLGELVSTINDLERKHTFEERLDKGTEENLNVDPKVFSFLL